MRNLYQYIALSLLLSSVTFASEKTSCIDRIPNSRNFIISGAVFRDTIRCLENLIETRHASTITAVQAQAAIAAKKDNQKIDANKTDETDENKKNITKKNDVLSNLSVQLIAQPSAKENI